MIQFYPQWNSMNIIFPQLGTSPLHLAAQYGHYSTAEVLLRAGVSRDARTKVDRTPLHMAAADGHAHVVELLVRVKQEWWWDDALKHSPPNFLK